MRLENVESISIGTRLGNSIFAKTGRLLLRQGVALTAPYISSLREMGVPAIYVHDDDTSDIQIPQPITPETRALAQANLADTFESVAKIAAGFKQATRSLAAEHIKSDRFAKAASSIASDAGIKRIFTDVNSLLDQLMDQNVLVGLNSIKSHDHYTFQHSIDVTIMSIVLAKKANWHEDRIRAFGIGCILHDIGKVVIEPAVLNKSGPLTNDEFETVKMHPAIGREMIRAMAPSLGYLVPQVAYQHHEREDGSGYPRGLRGEGSAGARSGPRIHEFGSLAAVADVYDALTSHRCYRPGWSPDRAIQYIADLAGTKFSPRAVRILLKAVARFPVCSSVRVLNGKYAGSSGVVAAVPIRDLSRPKVRLLSNPSGIRMSPVEIDLAVHRDITIQAIAPGERNLPQVARAA